MEPVVIVPFFEGHKYLDRLLDSLAEYSDVKRVVIIDDSSSLPLQTGFKNHKGIQVLTARPETKGFFTGAVNHALTILQSPLGTYPDVLIMNQDTYLNSPITFNKVIPEYRLKFDVFGERNKGSSVSFPNGYIQGTFMYISGRALDVLGLMDQVNFPLWGSTADYVVRAYRARLKVSSIEAIPGFVHERDLKFQFGKSISHYLGLHDLKRGDEEYDLLVRTPPLVTVVIPCYNYGHYLQDCLASLIGGESTRGLQPGQSFKSFEVVIVDDCSTDDSLEVARSLADTDSLIRVYQTEKNSGTVEAISLGIKNSKGRYITILSADDMRSPDSLEKLYQACDSNPGHFAYDDLLLWETNDKGESRDRDWPMPEKADLRIIRYNNKIHAGIMYSRNDYQSVGGYPVNMGLGREDWAINVAFLSGGVCGVHVPGSGYIYRRHQSNRTLSNSGSKNHKLNLNRLKRLYPSAYDDRRVNQMSCCGGSRPVFKPVPQASPSIPKKGSAMTSSLVRLTYLGQLMSKTYTGQVTNQRYRFGKDRPHGYVYQEDLQQFLEFRENGFDVFKRFQEPVIAQVTEPEPEPEPLLESDGPTADLDISQMTVAEIKDTRTTRSEWQLMLDEERNGKDRSSVVTFIEKKLES